MAEEFCLYRRRRKRLRTATTPFSDSTMSSSPCHFSFRGEAAVGQNENIGEREGETFSDLTRRAISISSAEGQSPGLLTNEGDNDDDTVVDLTNDSGVEDAEHVDLTSPITEINTSHMRYAPVSERGRGRRRGRRRVGEGSDVVVLDESDEEVQIMEQPQLPIASAQVTSTPTSEKSPCSPTKNLIKCPICMENALTFEKRGSQVMVTTCGHVFCNFCIRRAISEQKRCPTCRKRLNVRQIHPLYLSM